MKRKEQTIIFIIVFILVAGLGFWRVQQIRSTRLAEQQQALQAQFNGAMFDPVIKAPEVQLTDHRGNPFSLHALRGHAVVLFFGFTSCPDVCPATLAHFRQVKQLLGDEADDVRFVMVTVDPERDTPERMNEYISAFDPDFIGATGTLDEVRVAWDDYSVQPRKVELPESALGYTVEHPASAYVIDTRGDMRLMHFFGMPADIVAEDISLLLRT